MPTKAQLAANRANSVKSTGPKSPEGKSISAHNAITHGFYSKAFVVAEDEQADFKLLQNELHDDFEPPDIISEDIFQQILHASWNLFRLRRLENQTYALSPDPFGDDATVRKLDHIRRHKGHFERSLRAARKDYATHVTNYFNITAIPADMRANYPVLADIHSFHKAHVTKWKLYNAEDFVSREAIEEDQQRRADAQPILKRVRAKQAAKFAAAGHAKSPAVNF